MQFLTFLQQFSDDDDALGNHAAVPVGRRRRLREVAAAAARAVLLLPPAAAVQRDEAGSCRFNDKKQCFQQFVVIRLELQYDQKSQYIFAHILIEKVCIFTHFSAKKQ